MTLAARGKDLKLHPGRVAESQHAQHRHGLRHRSRRNFVQITVPHRPVGIRCLDAAAEDSTSRSPACASCSIPTPAAAGRRPRLSAAAPAGRSARRNKANSSSPRSPPAPKRARRPGQSQPAPVGRVTANSWLRNTARRRPRHAQRERLVARADHEGPVHITVTFAQPLDAGQNAVHDRPTQLRPRPQPCGRTFEILAFTGTDDGSPLPTESSPSSRNRAADRTTDEQNAIPGLLLRPRRRQPSRDRIPGQSRRATRVLTQVSHDGHGCGGQAARHVHSAPAATTRSRPTKSPRHARRPAAAARGAPPNRLGLAQWITMRENPLTARVAVNRIWQMLFGAGW